LYIPPVSHETTLFGLVPVTRFPAVCFYTARVRRSRGVSWSSFSPARTTDLLNGLSLDDEVLGWVTEALRQSHSDAKRHHDAAISRLQAEYNRLQTRIDAMYLDKLDGRVDAAFFDRKASEWRREQDRLLLTVEDHQNANQTYMEEGVRLLELAQEAPRLFQRQPPLEKRRLLNFLLSNCSWKGGELTASFRQPFDMLADMNSSQQPRHEGFATTDSVFDNWLPKRDAFTNSF
jgi:site-specific DNA recombinase